MTKKEAVDQFVDRVNYLHDSNYGDFKRKLDLAATRMWEVLGHDSRVIDNLLYDLKKKTVYSAGLAVDDARNLAIETAEAISLEIN